MAFKEEEKELLATSVGVVAGYGASVAAASTATAATAGVPALTLAIGAKVFTLLPAVAATVATAPIIAPVVAAGLVGAGATYIVKKIFK